MSGVILQTNVGKLTIGYDNARGTGDTNYNPAPALGSSQKVVAGTTACEISGDLIVNGRIYSGSGGTIQSPTSATLTPAQGASTGICIVTIQLLDAAGNNFAGTTNIDIYLSDSAAGAGLTATTASGAVQNDGTTGFDLGVLTAKKALSSMTTATGAYNLSITDSAKTGFYVVVAYGTQITVSAQLVTANYHP